MPTPSRTRLSRLMVSAGGVLGVLFATALPSACSEPEAKQERECTPNKKVFCRCRDRGQGEALCNATGTGWVGPCEPCETYDNPALPPGVKPDGSFFSRDASSDAPLDGPATSCGNGVVDEDEDCDDDNDVDPDGCNRDCRLSGDNPLMTRACPGLDVHVWSRPVEYDGSTIGAPLITKVDPTCPSDQGNVPTRGDAGPERIFHVVAHKTGLLTATTSNADFNSFLYVQQVCSTGDYVPYLACTNKVHGVEGETLTIPVEAGEAYTLFVDGAGIEHVGGGNFHLKLTID